MTMMRAVAPGAMLVFVLAGCADNPTAPASATVRTQAAGPGWLDGDYQGKRAPDVGNPACGFEAQVGYDVRGSTIQLRTRKQRRALAGSIDPSGRFSMVSADGALQVVGEIHGNRLTATEIQPPHHHRRSGGEAVQGGVCTSEITASRVSNGS